MTVSMEALASMFVAAFSSRSIPGTIYWDTSVQRSPAGFGLVIFKNIHRRIHLATRIQCTRQTHGVDCIVIQDLIIRGSIEYAAITGLLVLAIPLFFLLSMVLFFLPFLIFPWTTFFRSIYGNPRRAIDHYPNIVANRSTIMHLLSDLRDSAQSTQ